jgi:hypothetical protein
MNKKIDSNPAGNTASNSSAGGVFIAFGGIFGAVLGGFMGQPSIGLLAGLGLGGIAAIAVWLKDRD